MSGIYIHIPLCHSKCAYCDFYSRAIDNVDVHESLVRNMVIEYRNRRDELSLPVSTIYIGGGTPSILAPDTLGLLISELPVDGVDEFTIEANPEDVTADKVKAWRELGINRVSMGVQSLVDSELKLIGRRHDAATAIKAVETLRKGGIQNISLDLIYGLPSQTLDSWRYSLSTLLDMAPQHFSAYILSYEEGTRLTSMLEAGVIDAADDELIVEMYRHLTHEAASRGYVHYEISNFALPGLEAKHNSSYWTGTPYLGIGPAAHSFTGKKRRVNPSDIRAYNLSIDKNGVAFTVDPETRIEQLNDVIVTSLRTLRGLDFKKVPISRRRKLLCDAYRHIRDGRLLVEGGFLRIPEAAWLLSDAVIRDLLVVTSRP